MCRRARRGEQLFHPQDNRVREEGSEPDAPDAGSEMPAGVCWVASRQRYRVRLTDAVTGRRVSLGMFPTLASAVATLAEALRRDSAGS